MLVCIRSRIIAFYCTVPGIHQYTVCTLTYCIYLIAVLYSTGPGLGWHTNNSPMTQISQVYILPLWISDHLHEKFKNLNIPFLFSKSEYNTWYACALCSSIYIYLYSLCDNGSSVPFPAIILFQFFWDLSPQRIDSGSGPASEIYHDSCSFSNGAVTFF